MKVSVMLTEQIDRLFEKSVTRQVLDESEQGKLPAALWSELENIGVTFALVPEDAGGVGLAWSDAEGAWRAVGYHAAPVPLGETMIGRWALASAGLEIPEGPLALACDLLRLDEAGRLHGADVVVPWADQVEHIVAVAVRSDQPHLCLLRRADVQARTQASIARIPGARLSPAGVVPLAAAPLAAGLGSALGLLPHLAALRAAQMGGCLDRMLALCVEYGNTRTQFGKPIGKFQAVQHMIATLAEQSAAARMAGSMACRSLDKGDLDFGIAAAKIQAGQSASAGAAIAHQVFGAIGVTEEHSLHFFTRRLWQWRDEGQTEHWWAERLGRRVIAAGGGSLWATLVGW